MRTATKLLSLTAIALGLSACGGGGSGPATTAPVTYYETMRDQIIEIHNEGYKGNNVEIAIVDNFNYTYSDGTTHGGAVKKKAKAIAPNATLTEINANNTNEKGIQADLLTQSGYGYCLLTNGSYGFNWNCPHGSTTALGNKVKAADIVNYSFNSNITGQSYNIGKALYNEIDNGQIHVVSAGNDGYDCKTYAKCNSVARALINTASTRTIVVGEVIDKDGETFETYSEGSSNKAGKFKNNYIVTISGPGSYCNAGTSCTAPVVAGAAALLKQKFNQDSNAAIVKQIFDTTDDLGDPGIDDVYGRGRLNIKRAMSPIGNLQ